MTIDAAFTHFPTLTTQRLRLRQVEPSDTDALFAFKSDAEVTHAYGQEPHASPADSLAWIQRLRTDYERRDALFWALTLKAEERVIGECLFWNFDPAFHYAELGYELHPTYWHQGLMAEAVTAILSFGFGELGLHRVEANPLAENETCRKFLLKLGFTHEGTLRQRVFFRGSYLDQLYFGLLEDEWRK
jgi:[ribosomal protein S5]-alanine N-acetyltransferase